MKRLILPFGLAVLCHLLFFIIPVFSVQTCPSSPTKGQSIHVSLSVASVQHVAQATPLKEVVKEVEKKVTPPLKKVTPRHIQRKKVVKKKCVAIKPTQTSTPLPEKVTPPAEVEVEEAVAEVTPSPSCEPKTDAVEAEQPAPDPAFGGVQASTTPVSTYAPEPRYPKAAIRRGYQGVVILRVLVRGDGQVEEVEVETSSGHAVLDRSAIKGVKKWRFSTSATQGSSWITQPVRFELKGA